jgi:hypothetical protein
MGTHLLFSLITKSQAKAGSVAELNTRSSSDEFTAVRDG